MDAYKIYLVLGSQTVTKKQADTLLYQCQERIVQLNELMGKGKKIHLSKNITKSHVEKH